MPKDGFDPDSQAGMKRQLVFRKAIRMSGFSVPFIAMAFGTIAAAAFILAVSALYCVSEYRRLNGRSTPVLAAITDLAMRTGHGEAKDAFIKAPLYLAAGILVSLIVFPEPVNYVAIAVVALGDGAATVVGKLYGRTRIPHCNGKTLEGTIAGLACAFAGSLIFASPLVALAAAAVGMLVELLPLRVNDNLAVPLVTGSVVALAVM